MKKLVVAFTGFLMLSMQVFGVGVDTSQSNVNWHGKKVTGDHTGTIKIKSGKLEMADGKLTGGNIVMDMTTINVTDLSGKWKKKLDNHLNSGDFFNTDKHKTASLKVTKVEPENKGTYKVTADLTIKDITEPVTFNVKKEGNKFTGKLTFDRTKYNIKYNSGSFFKGLGDKMIYDDVGLNFTIATN